VDLVERAADILAAKRVECRFTFLTPVGVRITVRLTGPEWRAVLSVAQRPGEWTAREAPQLSVAVRDVLELAIPLNTLALKSTDAVAFSLALVWDGTERERYPAYRLVETQVPPTSLDIHNWRV
jgi:hypothetical protein